MTRSTPTTRTVVILGAAYGGIGAIGPLARRLPDGWRLVVIDRQTHANHVYPFPRFTVLPKHAPKAFMPLGNVFKGSRVLDVQHNVAEDKRTGAPLPPVNTNPGPHRLVHAIITDLTPHAVTFVKANAEGNFDDVKDDGSDAPADRVETVDFDYCVYALGGALSAPSDVWGDIGRKQYPGRGTKPGGIEWLTRLNGVIAEAKDIIVVGGGALGIQFATDIKDVNPEKNVTLLHSRDRLMPIYDQGLHDAIVKRCEELGIKLVLGERVLEWPESPGVLDGKTKVVKTSKGTELTGDLVLVCTGTKPSVELMAKIDPKTIAPNGCISIKDTMQIRRSPAVSSDLSDGVADLSLGDYDHMFAIGDCCDTTAIRAGHMAYAMGGVAARNILRLIDAVEKNEVPDLEIYEPEGPRIKVTLGLKNYCVASDSSATPGENGVEDIGAKGMWVLPGAQALDDNE